MVDAQPAGMGQVGAQHLQEGRIAAAAQPARREHRHAPVLPERVVQVRRRACVEAGQDLLLPRPGLAAARVGAHRQVGDDADRHARAARRTLRACHAVGGNPLQESVVGDLIGMGLCKGRHGGIVGRAQRDRPAAPVRRGVVVQAVGAVGQPPGLDGFVAGVRVQRGAAARAKGGAVIERRARQQRFAVLP
ncbi:hypothetical protein D9M72_471720 [compost metagenome]